LAAAEVKSFRDTLCQFALGAVTLRFMLFGPTPSLRALTATRSAFADAALARARRSLAIALCVEQCRPELGAKAKKQPLI